ncbi:mediator of RNA polymerase II transcription subunit [Rhynchospora pubera]|uniref:Mediator of RNA polymerase II transcription subunit n=2 Tax=Rhynchospora pubera TaxID=906938 RepID=A0AAV8DUE1_9POAL|nr:mediator of RNA polymerase II transcription subunit [Rhynchospora pubera]
MFSSSSSLSSFPLQTKLKSTFPRTFPKQLDVRRSGSVVMVGSRDGWDLDSDRVDEDMIILRKRIHEIRITEESISEPSGWMEWEKEYYMTAAYASDVYELVGLLQRFLMNTRPSLAIGTVLLVLLSVPTSLGFLLHRLLIALGSMLSALHTS